MQIILKYSRNNSRNKRKQKDDETFFGHAMIIVVVTCIHRGSNAFIPKCHHFPYISYAFYHFNVFVFVIFLKEKLNRFFLSLYASGYNTL